MACPFMSKSVTNNLEVSSEKLNRGFGPQGWAPVPDDVGTDPVLVQPHPEREPSAQRQRQRQRQDEQLSAAAPLVFGRSSFAPTRLPVGAEVDLDEGSAALRLILAFALPH